MVDLSKTECSGNELVVLFSKYFKGDKNEHT
jgi:hypothetical protein